MGKMAEVSTKIEQEEEATGGEDFEWDVDSEIQLFYAMFGHKPVGVNKHFNMLYIWEKFTASINKEVPSTVIWKHLDSLYDLNMLDDTESPPFPTDEVDFSLPEKEYGELMRQKIKEVGSAMEEAEDRSISPRIQSTPRSVSRGATSRENTPKAGLSRSELRDSRDSNTSAGGRESTGSSKSSAKTTKGTKGRHPKKRQHSADDGTQTPDSDTPSSSKRGPKRPTRGSIARAGGESTPPPPTPLSARRRRI